MFFAHSVSGRAATAVLLFVSTAFPGHSLASPGPKRDEPNHSKPLAANRREESLARARWQVLALLQEENACSAWFRESEGDPAEVFESLQFKVQSKQPPYIFHVLGSHKFSGQLYKHPWVARSWQLAGRNSTVEINRDGAFFSPSSPVVETSSSGTVARYLGFRMLTVGPFKGGTSEAQITTLLHELGHITDRIPQDADSWDGKSSRNTEEILRHCKPEVIEFAKRSTAELE